MGEEMIVTPATTAAPVTGEIPAVVTPSSTGSATESWSFADNLPETLRDKPWAQDFAKSDNPFHALANGYEGAQIVIGKKSAGLEVPGENATPEQVKAFNKAIGVPETVEGYAYTAPDVSKLPEKVQGYLAEISKDTTIVDAMKQEALLAGVPPKAFAKMAAKFDELRIKEVTDIVAGSEALVAKAAEDRKATFTKFYGDKADQVKATANATMAKVFSKDLIAGGDAELMLIDALRFIDEKVYRNDTINTQGQGASTESGADIQTQISQLRAKKDKNGINIYDTATHGEHDALVKQLHTLYAKKRALEDASKG